MFVWRDQYRATYLVDNTGTRPVPKVDEPAPVVMEIYRPMPELAT